MVYNQVVVAEEKGVAALIDIEVVVEVGEVEVVDELREVGGGVDKAVVEEIPVMEIRVFLVVGERAADAVGHGGILGVGNRHDLLHGG